MMIDRDSFIPQLSIIILITCIYSCGSINSTSIQPAFRHPLFHQATDIQSSSFGLNHNYFLPTRTSPASCSYTFTHPLLGNCEHKGSGRDKLTSFSARSNKSLWNLAKSPLEHQLAIARRARSMLGYRNSKKRFKAGNKLFRRDCSGLIMAVYALENLPLDSLIHARKKQSMVGALYRMARKHGLLHHNKVPAIGDLVFFSDTYDRNHDGRMNDYLTHVGIVERIDSDGTVSFIHHARGGVLRYKLNRFKPSVRRDKKSKKVYNHYLRTRSSHRRSSTHRRLTGQLFEAFATLVL